MENKKVSKFKKVLFSLPVRIGIIAIIPLLVMAIVVSVVGVNSIQEGISIQLFNQLESTTIAMAGMLDSIDEGEYVLDAQNNLLKGDYNLTEHPEALDRMVEDTYLDVTFFWDKTRRATTLKDKESGERILGTDASDAVYQKVVKEGQSMTADNLVINGEEYYAFYSPLKNSEGEVVGMLFAGAPATESNAFISKEINKMTGVAAIVMALALIVIIICVVVIRKAILVTHKAVQGLGGGNLSITVEASALKRQDELGDMAREVELLKNKLFEMMSNIRDEAETLMNAGHELSTMANQTSATADEISRAVEGVSSGAFSQAEDVENATGNVDKMGQVITKIVQEVAALDSTSNQMKESRNAAMGIISELTESNQKTLEAINNIGTQVKITNESAGKISEAIEIITSIAEETNLLSLNASIEAARAGEQGRGFAVVAGQIQTLADQSNESSQKIKMIAENLLLESNRTVEIMDVVRRNVNEESEKLNMTKTEFEHMSQGILETRSGTNDIKEHTGACDTSRANVVDVMNNLSAISEENAASAEETMASMEELNSTINLLAGSADALVGMSKKLEELMTYFQF